MGWGLHFIQTRVTGHISSSWVLPLNSLKTKNWSRTVTSAHIRHTNQPEVWVTELSRAVCVGKDKRGQWAAEIEAKTYEKFFPGVRLWSGTTNTAFLRSGITWKSSMRQHIFCSSNCYICNFEYVLFTQQICTKGKLCSWRCSRCQWYSSEELSLQKKKKIPEFIELTFYHCVLLLLFHQPS